MEMNKRTQKFLALALVLFALAAWTTIIFTQPEKDDTLHMSSLSDEPLFVAIQSKDYDKMEELLEEDPNLANKQHIGGGTYLNCAAASGDKKIVEILLKHGANPNGSANCGMSPLVMACSNGDVEVARQLLEAGADPNIFGFGICPLTNARDTNNEEMEKLLLEYDAIEVTSEDIRKKREEQNQLN